MKTYLNNSALEKRTIPQIILNKDNIYQGDLRHYARVVWYAPNFTANYHDGQHMFHVMWATYHGALFYGDKIDSRTLRNMLIAALMHDYNHRGEKGPDSVNIENAIKGLRNCILPEDLPYIDEIIFYIKGTEFPHKAMELTLPAMIIRDSDIAYTLSPSWIQKVNWDLSREVGISVEAMLRSQEDFLRNHLKLSTDWAKEEYGIILEKRIEEANELVYIFYGN
jgi:hypothetical protein